MTDPDLPHGLTLAAADLDSDDRAEFVVGAGPGSPGRVAAYSPVTGKPLPGPLGGFLAFAGANPYGVSVATGDVDADGTPDLVTSSGNRPRVKVFRGTDV